MNKGEFDRSTVEYQQKRKRKIRILWGVLIGVFLFVTVLSSLSDKSASHSNSYSSSSEKQQETKTSVGIGQTLRTDYFDVTVSKAYIVDRVNTGNQFSDLKPEAGNLYMILNVSFTNTSDESRMIVPGSVFINYNGKEYEFDQTETIMAEGWGVLLDQINPLITKSTKLVYKIPQVVSGTAFYEPGRNGDDARIDLGELNK